MFQSTFQGVQFKKFSIKKGTFTYKQACEKRLLSQQYLDDRVAFSSKVLKHRLGPGFWREKLAFYLDSTSFHFKTNHLDQTRAPKSRIWRKKQGELYPGCTAKSKKAGSVNTNIIVVIPYDSGVVFCEKYEDAING